MVPVPAIFFRPLTVLRIVHGAAQQMRAPPQEDRGHGDPHGEAHGRHQRQP